MGTLVTDLSPCASWMADGNLYNDPDSVFPDNGYPGCDETICLPPIECAKGYPPGTPGSIPWNYATSLSAYLECDGSPSNVWRIKYAQQKTEEKYQYAYIPGTFYETDQPPEIQIGWYPGACNGLSIQIYSLFWKQIDYIDGKEIWESTTRNSYPYYALWAKESDEPPFIPPTGWEWDTYTGVLTKIICDKEIASCIDLSGPINVCRDQTYTYTVTQHIDSKCINTIAYGDKTIYISYSGSILVNGVDFNGPTSVYIPLGERSVDFNISINTEFEYGKYINITIESSIDYAENENCNTNLVSNLIECDDSNINTNTCCSYMPKNYIPWSDGIGIKTLIPPNKR